MIFGEVKQLLLDLALRDTTSFQPKHKAKTMILKKSAKKDFNYSFPTMVGISTNYTFSVDRASCFNRRSGLELKVLAACLGWR